MNHDAQKRFRLCAEEHEKMMHFDACIILHDLWRINGSTVRYSFRQTGAVQESLVL